MTGAADRHLILGFPRSGTTLLSRLIDAHPEISSPPETFMFSSAARFLAEQSAVEGPPIGVLSGLAFAGFEPEEVMGPLRAMLFGWHERIAAGKPAWAEKTGTDVFHLETLEPFLAGHARFVILMRNPLDVIASNMDLAATMGAQLPELFALTRGVNDPHEGLARALADRTEALDAFVDRNAAECHRLRYEDLLTDPETVLTDLFAFMGRPTPPRAVIDAAFTGERKIGLGDFRIHETSGLGAPVKDGWRKRLPRAAAARIIPILAPLLERHGYKVPKTPAQPGREDAVRQFTLAARMRGQMRPRD